MVCVGRRPAAAVAASSAGLMAESDDEFYDCDTDEGQFLCLYTCHITQRHTVSLAGSATVVTGRSKVV